MNAASSGTVTSGAGQDIRPAWGWFVALGVGLLCLGGLAFANLSIATVVSVLYVGILVAAGGIAQIVHAFRERSWSGFLFWLLAGVLYGVAGFLVWINPLFGAVVLTLLLAASLVGSGLLRIWAGFRLRPLPGSGWVIASGSVTVLAGLIFLVGWPINSLWLLGVVLAVDLMFQGGTAIAFGLMLRSISASGA